MRLVSFVSLNTETGELRRYRVESGHRVRETGRTHFANWNPLQANTDWARVWQWIQNWRTAYVEPEAPPPRPTSPLATQMREAA